MINLAINGRNVSVEDGATILQAAKQAGIRIPTLCSYGELNTLAACRICVVEVEGEPRLTTACNTPVHEGMVVRTNTPRVIEARRGVLELILSEHDTSCTTCLRDDTCELRKLCSSMGIDGIPYPEAPLFEDWEWDFPLWRDTSKCIRCMRCVSICSKVQGCGVWGVDEETGAVAVRDGLSIFEAGCTLCGQCVVQCPTGALVARDDTARVMQALADPDTTTIVNIAPAVRTSWGEGLGVSREQASVGRLVSACKQMGFDYVFDVDFGADMTIMEEASELVAALSADESDAMPLFTSCCPAWVRFVKQRYPKFVANLSTSKSPHEMLAAVEKTYFADNVLAIPRERVFVVSVMPCIAKKYEVGVEKLDAAGTGADVDVSLSVRELDRLVKRFGIDVANLDEASFDEPLGFASGGGHIFGRTGGVMEAALRTASKWVNGSADLNVCAVEPACDGKPWMEKEIVLGDRRVKLAVASGLGNATQLLEALESGTASFDFVEIMACPGGCVGGGGQPIAFNEFRAPERASVSNALDAESDVRLSCDNPAIQKLYADYLGTPLEGTAHELLHTDQASWEL